MDKDDSSIAGDSGDAKPLDDLAADSTRLRDGESPRHDDGREERGRDIDLQALREVMYSLHAVSIGTHQVLYFSAMKYCKNHVAVTASTVEEAIAELTALFDSMNLGTLRIKEGEESGHDGRILLELVENALTFDADTDKPVCYFLSGYIAGYLESALDEHFVVNEIACTSQGNDACVFRAQRR